MAHHASEQREISGRSVEAMQEWETYMNSITEQTNRVGGRVNEQGEVTGQGVQQMDLQKEKLIQYISGIHLSSGEMAELTVQLAAASEHQMNSLLEVSHSADELRALADFIVKQGERFSL